MKCFIAGGPFDGREALLPRIQFTPSKEDKSPFMWETRQFPVRPAFAMTINKSQSQTLSKAGVWLNKDVFTHGQLYVASSRVGHPNNITYVITSKVGQLGFHHLQQETWFSAKFFNNLHYISISNINNPTY